MSLFYLIKQNHRIRIPSDFLTELSSFFISHISWRRSHQLGDTVFLHIFRHVYTDHGLFTAKHYVCQYLGQFRLSHTGRSKEQERTNRTFRILQTHTASLDCLRHCCHCLILSNHSLVQSMFQLQQPMGFLFFQLLHRNLCPHRYDLCDLILANLRPFLLSLLIMASFCLLQLFHQLVLFLIVSGSFFPFT